VLDVADGLGVDRFLYMGASWGGSIGVHLAANHPDRLDGLVLLDGGHVDLPRGVARADLVRYFEGDWTRFEFDSWDDFLAFANERVRTWRASLEPRYRGAMTERNGKIVPRASATAAGLAAYGVISEPPSSVYARVTVPILLLAAGRNEPAAAVERFLAAVPSATVCVLDSGHDIVEDAPEETASALLDWLR
jgi:pimeloyl-ACP methyl ester carboxylesterase